MKNKLILLLLPLCLFLSCLKNTEEMSSILQTIPPNAVAILKVNQFKALKKDLKENPSLQSFKETPLYISLLGKLKGLDSISLPSQSLISFVAVGKEQYEYLISIPNTNNFTKELAIDSLKTILYEKKEYKSFILNNVKLYSYILSDVNLVSSSQLLIENSIRNGVLTPDPILVKLYNSSESSKTASVFLHTEGKTSWIKTLLNEKTQTAIPNFSNWYALDIESSSDKIVLSGIAIPKDSLKNIGSLFNNMPALEHHIHENIPQNAKAVLSYTFGNFDVFLKNQQSYLDRATPLDPVFSSVEELAIVNFSKEKMVVLKTFSNGTLEEQLKALKQPLETFEGLEIYSLKDSNLLNQYFNPLVSEFDAKYQVTIGDYYLFSSNLTNFKSVLRNLNKGNTYQQNPVFLHTKENLSSESSILFLSSATYLKQLLSKEKITGIDWDKSPLADQSFSIQITPDYGFLHTHIQLSNLTKTTTTSATSLLFSYELDATIGNTPQFVKNHKTKKQDIIVQDVQNALYLISADGDLLWKKELKGPVQGKIEQVDLYKNGNLQLAFTTDTEFLVLDRNGKEVAPFSFSYKGTPLNSLAVFDYDNSKKYRFVVTQGKKVFMYDKNGKEVSGFKFNNAKAHINTAPKHFRVGRKDYLVFSIGNSFAILNRVGKTRIKQNASISFSDNDFYLYQDKFSATDNKGVLHQIDEKGKLSTTPLNLGTDHGIVATNKTFVSIHDNIINIRGKKTELDFGVYTKPQIFYKNNRILVGVTDLQNKKCYLFDSQSKLIPGFPIYGKSSMDIENIDTDKNLELVLVEDDHMLSIYKIK